MKTMKTMKTRPYYSARLAALVAATAVVGMLFLAPETATASENPFPGSILDGWANRDIDIGTF